MADSSFDEFTNEDFPSEDGFDFDSDEEYYDDTFEPPPLKKSNSFIVVEESDILNKAKTEIAEIMEVLGIPSQALSVILLRHYNWNKEKLINKYTEDPRKICKEAGIRPSLELEKKPKSTSKKIRCTVCYEDFRASKTFALGCGHRFCLQCWSGYLQVQIKDGKECLSTRCMNKNCKDIVHDEAVKKLVPPDAFERYNRFLLRSYVEDNPMVKWCPAPDCSNCVRCDRLSRTEPVTCRCGFTFCFSCADYDIGDHSPAACKLVEAWKQKSKDESENVNWLIANTKNCPQCRAPIEKNGGCMHMVCSKNAGGCGFEFCWLCRGNWTDHGTHTGGYYSCNKYDASDAKKQDRSAEDVKTELELYMFYYHRYDSHVSAGKIAKSQFATASQRALDLQVRFDVRSEDTKFLTEATEQLLRNRRVLQYSYVMGYYLTKSTSPEKNLFEFLQEDLEKYTNRLSELYESDITHITSYEDFMKWKLEVIDFTRISFNFLNKFVEGISTGLTVLESSS